MRWGVHMPQKGGFQKNARRSKEIGCQCLQIFPGNPTSWKLPSTSPEEISQRSQCLQELEISPLVIHGVYLINLASPKPEVYQKSREVVKDTMERAALYGAPYVIVHSGSHGSAGREKGISRVIEALEEQIPHWPSGVTLLLENTSGGGNLLGGSLKDLGEIIRRLWEAPLGVCFDTAHAWGAGYDMSHKDGVRATLEELFEQVQPSRLKVIHANDTMEARGSGKDRHHHIGEGQIGEKGFQALLQAGWHEDFPIILETPEMGTEKDRDNLVALKRCLDTVLE